jgi:hypothetical protein
MNIIIIIIIIIITQHYRKEKANPTQQSSSSSSSSIISFSPPASVPWTCQFLSIPMEDFRSKSCRDGGMQIDSYYGGRTLPASMQDLRSYSVSYGGSSAQPNQIVKEVKMKKGKSSVGSISKSWSFTDPELQRKKRVAGYKVYAVEGKVKGSLRKSFRWIKKSYTQVLYGWRWFSSVMDGYILLFHFWFGLVVFLTKVVVDVFGKSFISNLIAIL